MEIIENKDVLEIYNNYPDPIKEKLLHLRQLVLDTAQEIEADSVLEETLKWGEPSYCTEHGSTIRIDWKESNPDHYALYFNCKTKLVDTFRELYRDVFTFEGNRAILFCKKDNVPDREVKHCILLSLTYHNIKHLPLLGA